MSSDIRLESKIARRFVPFVAVGVLALLASLLPPRPDDWTYVWFAALFTALIAASGFAVPWSRLPRWTYLLPPLAYFGVVAMLRHASDGSVSGYAALLLLPVVWIALNLGRREVVLGIVVGTSVLIVPLVLGAAHYDNADFRRALLWAATASVVGFAIESLVREKRAQTKRALNQERTLSAVLDVARSISTGEDARNRICDATLEVADATFAAIYEPDASGDLVLTGIAGPDPGRDRFRLDDERSGTVRAYTTGSSYFVADAAGDATIANDPVRRIGAVSSLFEPIVRNGVVVGVLGVGWPHRIATIDEETARAVRLLAMDAAVAIERADLVSQLSAMADTDELTGLPNRRAWDEVILRAVGYATRTRRALCVAVVDLDHFKAYNDRHGHQAGDRLLKTASASWRTVLRASDTLARYGGEEFAVALPNCSADAARLVLARLRALTPPGQTCSLGLAEWTPGESAVDLVARADSALYEAKRAGRDALVAAART